MPKQLLREMWQLTDSDMPNVLSMFTAVSMLAPLPGPSGEAYFVSNLAHEYMAYWARMSGKGSSVGRLQRWLLSHQVRNGQSYSTKCKSGNAKPNKASELWLMEPHTPCAHQRH